MIIDDKDDITEINATLSLLWSRIDEINKRHKEGNGNRMIEHGLLSARECVANAKGYLNNVYQTAW